MNYLFDYGDVALKLAVGLCAFIIILRTSGRGVLNQMTPLDLINNFVLGGIISGVIYNRETTLVQFISILVIWEIFIIALNFIRKHSNNINKILVGGNVAVVVNSQYDVEKIKKLRMDLGDFATMLRIKDCGLFEADLVRFESNGELSVIKKSENKRLSLVVKGGKIVDDTLKDIGKTQGWLKEQLKKKAIKLEDVFMAEWYEEKDANNKWKSDLFVVPMSGKKTK